MTRVQEALTAPVRRSVGKPNRPDKLRAWRGRPAGTFRSGYGIAVGIAAVLLLAGCGYSRETPRLPGNAGTIAIATIRNRTTQGEVDVRLGHELRALFLKHPGIQMGSLDHTDLVLDIELTLMRVIRNRDLASTNLTSVQFQLVGDVSVYDRRTSQYFFYKLPVESLSRLDFDSPTIETPAIRDEGLDDAIRSFAERIENMLFYTF